MPAAYIEKALGLDPFFMICPHFLVIAQKERSPV
jgi:hypothetical protein